MMALRPWLAIVLVFSAVASRGPAQPAERLPVTGKLANGLTYVVMPHVAEGVGISLRLSVRVGSLDERDDERGFAHFVEHLAFEGTTDYPPGSIRRIYERLGLTFGPDLNASTSYARTNYLMDLPAGRADQLDESLRVLRNFSDGLLFPPDQVKREAGVVVSEIKARDGAGLRTTDQLLHVVYAKTPVPERSVGGLPRIIEGASPDQLRAFYRRHYTPDRMTVVMAGPVEPSVAIEKITASFGSLAAPAGASAIPAVPVAAMSAGIKSDVVLVPTAKGVNGCFIFVGERPANTAEGRRQELLQRVATAAFQGRLQAALKRDDYGDFGDAAVYYHLTPFAGLSEHTISVPVSRDDWPRLVRLVANELRRAAVDGFTRVELDEAAAGQLSYAKKRLARATTEAAATLADELSDGVWEGRPWRSPARQLAEDTEALKEMNAAAVGAELARIFPAESLHLVLVVPPDFTVKPERLLSVYQKALARPLGASAKEAAGPALVFRYDTFGKPGTVAKREEVADLGVTLVSFANGVQLNLHPTTFEPGRFRLQVVFPLNYSDIMPDRGGITELSAHLMMDSDLRKNSQSEIARLLELHEVEVDLDLDQGTPTVSLAGPSAELPFALRYLTATISDLKLDIDRFRNVLSYYAGAFYAGRNDPRELASRLALTAYSGGDRRTVMKRPEFFSGDEGYVQVCLWLSRHLIEGPVEIGLVGDFSTEPTLNEAAASVGTLKKRRGREPGKPLSSPAAFQRMEGSSELPASTSISYVLWPIDRPDDPRANAALELATDVLQDRQMLVLRETWGATYSPSVEVRRDAIQRDLAFVAATNTFDSAEAQKLNLVCLNLAADFATRGVSLEEYGRLREPARMRAARDLQSNQWWVDEITAAQRRPAVLEEIRRHGQIFDEVTALDVNAASKVFKPDRFISVVVHPASAKIPPVTKTRGNEASSKK